MIVISSLFFCAKIPIFGPLFYVKRAGPHQYVKWVKSSASGLVVWSSGEVTMRVVGKDRAVFLECSHKDLRHSSGWWAYYPIRKRGPTQWFWPHLPTKTTLTNPNFFDSPSPTTTKLLCFSRLRVGLASLTFKIIFQEQDKEKIKVINLVYFNKYFLQTRNWVSAILVALNMFIWPDDF